MADDRTFIKLHDGMPDHPKIEGLSDKAFRLLVETWCWSSRQRTDGAMPRSSWTKRGTPAARRELVAAGLVIDHGTSGIEMHDYLEHQRSAEQIAERSEKRKRAGAKGNHQRHHVGPNGSPTSSCPECVAEGLANGSQVREQERSHNGRNGVAPPLPTGSQSTRNGLAETEESLRDSQAEDPLRGSQPETDLPGADLGGGRPVGDADAGATAPRPNSDQGKRDGHTNGHAHDPQPCGRRHDPARACGACRDARRAAEQAEVDAEEAQRAERAAEAERRRACQACDTNGWLEHPETGQPVVRCDHETEPRQQLADALGLTP